MRVLRFDGPLHLRRTLGFLVAGPRDPTARATARELVRATRTPEGPATLHVEIDAPGRLKAQAWGPGAGWALDHAPDLAGLLDDLPDISEMPRRLRALAHAARGVRLPRTRRIVETLVLIVLQQKVVSIEATRAFARLVRAFSEPAPGPAAELLLPLGAEQLAALPLSQLPPLGVPGNQGRTLRRLGLHASRIEEADKMGRAAAAERLQAVDGIGPWSAAQALLRGMGDADAVPEGDYNLPSLVAHALAGEERADDARMLELLEPFRGQRGRVIRWIQVAGQHPPRRGPRRRLRDPPRA